MCSPGVCVEMREGSKVKFRNSAVSVPQPEICHWNEKRQVLKLNLPDPFWRVNTHKACLHNEYRACRNRVVAKTSPPSQTLTLACGNLMRHLATRLYPKVQMYNNMPELIKTFPAQKRKKYTQSLLSLLAEPLSQRDWQIKAFVKSEKLKIEERDGDPRMIQARSMRFNLEIGMYTKAVEKALYHLVDPDYQEIGVHLPIVAKGRNLYQRAQDLRAMWELMEDPVALSLDLSRWDMHVTTPLMKNVMHTFYEELIQHPWFQQLLLKQLNNRAVTENGLTYTNECGVTSGDMTTALGNCVAVLAILLLFRKLMRLCAEEIARGASLLQMLENVVGTVFISLPMDAQLSQFLTMAGAFLSDKRIQVSMLKINAMLIYDDGDDHVMMVARELYEMCAALLPPWWDLMGHVVKVEGYTDQFHKILFCQHKPFQANGRWVMCPDPYKVMATSCVVTGKNLEKPAVYLETVWRARSMLHQDVPVLSRFFRNNAWTVPTVLTVANLKHAAGGIYQLMRNRVPGKGVLEEKEIEGAIKRLLKWKPQEKDITPEMREMFYQQWGITPDHQRLMEQWEIPKVRGLGKITPEWLIKRAGRLERM